MAISFVTLRGLSIAVEYPTEADVQAIEQFVRDNGNKLRDNKESLATAIQSMMPSIPDYMASCKKYELPDGSNRIDTLFTLKAYELLGIVQSAATVYLTQAIEDLERSEPATKEEKAMVHNKIAQIKAQIAADELNQGNPILMTLKGELPPSVLPAIATIEPGSDEFGKPRPKGMGRPQIGKTAS